MTEIQAKSGPTDAKVDPTEPAADSSARPGGDGGAAAAGRAAVGRATVPGDPAAPTSGPPSATSVPKFTRAPGMSPPPDNIGASGDATAGVAPTSGAAAGVAVARASVRGGATTTGVRPSGLGAGAMGATATGAARV